MTMQGTMGSGTTHSRTVQLVLVEDRGHVGLIWAALASEHQRDGQLRHGVL